MTTNRSKLAQRALAGAEDLLLGQGTVTQKRNNISVTISKFNADNIPYTGDAETGDLVTVKEEIDNINAANAAYGADTNAPADSVYVESPKTVF